MKQKSFKFILAAMAIVGLAACKNEEKPQNEKGFDNQPIVFSSNLEDRTNMLKATDTEWTANDAIGVFATQGAAFDAGNLYADNKKHVTSTAGTIGKFAAADRTNEIVFPADASDLSMVAVYPYSASNSYAIDVTVQSNPEAIDLLYASGLKANKDTPTSNVKFQFKHKLAKMVFNSPTGTTITSATLSGFAKKANFSIANGAITNPTGADTNLTPLIATDGTQVTAIVVPNAAADLTVAVVIAGKNYTYTIKNRVVESGKKYTYNLKLEGGDLVLVNPDADIQDWEDGLTEDIVIGEDKDPGFDLSTSDIDMVAAGGTTTVTITSSDANLDWTATSSEPSWLTVTPSTGKGTGDITVTATQNDSGVDRQGTVTIAATASSTKSAMRAGETITKTITVRQVAESTGGVEETYYSEDFNGLTKDKEKINLTPEDGTEQTNDINGVSFVATGNVDIRNTTRLDSHLWFPSGKDATLVIKKGSEGHTNNRLTFDIVPNIYGATDQFDLANIGVRVGGESFSIPSRIVSKGNGDDPNTYIPIEITGLPDSFTEFEFSAKASTNTIGFRIDNIKLIGTK